ncbi:hypothetical protein ACJIZ3_014136 [Penstemon smallii]|uniref:SANT domain-containing protein n=1 Tax=Penstemon smallii TaxID=265156 RepID=A0ABD3RIQ0_9LAMI
MATLNLNKIGDPVDSKPIEQLLTPDLDGSGEPDECDDSIIPRIGDEFQVQIPPLIERSDYLSHSLDPIDKNQTRYLGSDIEVAWVDLNHAMPSKNAIKKEICSNGENSSYEDKCLVPRLSLPGEKWTEAEKGSFILGLYIFQRNFVEVKRFIETKEMGAILSFYYGEFYGSAEYRRWSDSRKKKSKKCVHGQRIFSGSRQQELMSRLLPTLSEDLRDSLSEVSKKFNDEKMSLVDYVSSLKSIVGINTLVKAIGIGKGKHDLTGMSLESSKSNPMRPEIPSGKACSSLTTSEIVQFLSGDYRLSKARSNDLFWEAVWPRLLARGWHSEQPKDQASYISGLKVCLVFIVPGVKKFSRRKLVKGEHYFDSVTDVLSKVAKEPELIELDSDEDNGKNKEDVDDDDLTFRQRHCYLQPRTPNRNADVMVFTVVDTSLSGGKVRELRSLPTEISFSLASKDLTNNYEGTDEFETTKKKTKSSGELKSVGTMKSEKDLRESKNKKPKKVSKSLSSQKMKRVSNGDYIAPLKKRCKKETGIDLSKSGPGPQLENGISSSCSRNNECNENLSYTSSSKGSPNESFECDPSGTERRTLIDLNVPQVSPELENGFVFAESGHEQDNNRRSEPDIVIPRRHSTRNRPPTTRALEALADGYLTVTRKRKAKEGSSSNEELAYRPQQRTRGVVGPTDSTARGVVGPSESMDSVVACQVEEAENGVANSDSRVHPEANEEPASG